MRRHVTLFVPLLFPVALVAQSRVKHEAPAAVAFQFAKFADMFGGRLVEAFTAIPADKYNFRPTASQQTIGYIAQHLEDANYALCERIGGTTHHRTARDSLADTVKALWPKDTLVARLDASLQFCDAALERTGSLDSPAVVNSLLAFETDLAEHYSQLSVYMRLLGLVPPSAIPPKHRVTIDVPATTLASYVGVYQLVPGLDLVVTLHNDALSIRSTPGGSDVRLWPESTADFFIKEVDAQVTFTRDGGGAVNGLRLRQFGRTRTAARTP